MCLVDPAHSPCSPHKCHINRIRWRRYYVVATGNWCKGEIPKILGFSIATNIYYYRNSSDDAPALLFDGCII